MKSPVTPRAVSSHLARTRTVTEAAPARLRAALVDSAWAPLTHVSSSSSMWAFVTAVVTAKFSGRYVRGFLTSAEAATGASGIFFKRAAAYPWRACGWPRCLSDGTVAHMVGGP